MEVKPVTERFGRVQFEQMEECMPSLDIALREGEADIVFALSHRITRAAGKLIEAATMQVDPLDSIEEVR